MTELEQVQYLNAHLLREMPQHQKQAESFKNDLTRQKALFRSLSNVRAPAPLNPEFLQVQDAFLQQEVLQKGVISIDDLPPTAKQSRLYLWQGDITRLFVDAIVNAANNALLGCFVPCHNCIDNVIHSAAGLQLREACHNLMLQQDAPEATGEAKITPAFNLPCRYVLHTVGPIVCGELQKQDIVLLKACYRSCLHLAAKNNLTSLAFCCISTGEYHFPNEEAAHIAVETVQEFLQENQSEMRVIFNVFKDVDLRIYQRLLGEAAKI